MDLILDQLEANDKHLTTRALKSLIALIEPISEEFASPLIIHLTKTLKVASSNSIARILKILMNFLQRQPSLSPIMTIIPELITIKLNISLQKLFVQFLEELIVRTKDVKFLSDCLLQYGLVNTTEERKLNTLQIIKDLFLSGHMIEELRSVITELTTDESINISTTASEILGMLNIKSPKNSIVNYDIPFIPAKFIENVLNSVTWKEKLFALKRIEGVINTLETPNELFNHLNQFVSFISKVVEDSDYKLTAICIEIMSTTIKILGNTDNEEVFLWVPWLLKTFSETKITIRQSIHKLLRLYFSINIEKLINNLTEQLDSDNWHVREEILMVLIALMLSYPSGYTYINILGNIAKLLDDTRNKIRIASTEALAIIANIFGSPDTLSRLSEIVDSEALKALSQRFSAKNLPVMTEDYILLSKEVPKECRLISSPYLTSSSIMPPIKNTTRYSSDERLTPGTPKTAETNKKVLTKQNSLQYRPKNLSALSKSSSVMSIPIPQDNNPAYLAFEELEPVPRYTEALQKCIFHTDDWLEQFEIVNTVRRLFKHHPEVFLSKVALHNIVLHLCRWGDSLRSSLSKNSLIALKEMCEKLGKSADGEICDVLKIFLKKSSDTNSFLAETATNGLEALCMSCSEGKVLLQVVSLAESTRNPTLKAKLMFCVGKIIQRARSGVMKFRDMGLAIKYITEYLTDASSEVRVAAKSVYELLIEQIPDENHLEFVLNQGIRDTTFRKLRETVKKRTKPDSTISVSVKSLRFTLPSLAKPSKNKISISSSARILIKPAEKISLSDEFTKIPKLEDDILNIEWRIRYDAISAVFEMIRTNLQGLIQSEKLEKLMSILQKGMKDQSLKVLIHSISNFTKIIPIVKKDIERYLIFLAEPVVISLGCSNTSIRDASWDACMLLMVNVDNELFAVTIIDNISKVPAKGKALALSLCVSLAGNIKNKEFLERHMLPVAFKHVDDNRVDIKNEAGKLILVLYKIIGKEVLERSPTKKMHRVISLISS